MTVAKLVAPSSAKQWPEMIPLLLDLDALHFRESMRMQPVCDQSGWGSKPNPPHFHCGCSEKFAPAFLLNKPADINSSYWMSAMRRFQLLSHTWIFRIGGEALVWGRLIFCDFGSQQRPCTRVFWSKASSSLKFPNTSSLPEGVDKIKQKPQKSMESVVFFIFINLLDVGNIRLGIKNFLPSQWGGVYKSKWLMKIPKEIDSYFCIINYLPLTISSGCKERDRYDWLMQNYQMMSPTNDRPSRSLSSSVSVSLPVNTKTFSSSHHVQPRFLRRPVFDSVLQRTFPFLSLPEDPRRHEGTLAHLQFHR